MSAVVLEDGKISVPQEALEAVGFRPGTALEVQAQGATLVVRKRETADAFEKWRGRGSLPAGADVDEYLGVTRDGDRS